MNPKHPIVLLSCGAVTVMVIVAAVTISFQAGKHSTQSPVPSTRPVPVKITYRRSVLGNGYVFRFRDIDTTELFCTVSVRGSTVGKRYRLDLKPNEFKEIGVLQGWVAFPGDRCTVDADGFAQISGQIPEVVN
ncbi:MAG: hypothetical protein ACREFR_13660 [Limisphaerales bacterium]